MLFPVPLFIAIIALTAVIWFSMTACENEDDDNGGGVLTITGLDNYNGKYVIAYVDYGENITLIAADSIDVKNLIAAGGEISDGSVFLKVWKLDTSDDKNISAADYGGNNTVTFDVKIFKNANVDMSNEESDLVRIGTVKVTFKKGTASGIFTARSDNDNIGIGIQGASLSI